MESLEELDQNCDSSSKSNPSESENCEQESDNQSQEEEDNPGNESEKEEGTGENSNDLLESEASASEKQNEGEWYDFSEDEEDESEDEEVNESVIDELLEQGLPESKRLEKPPTTPRQVEKPSNNKKPVERCPVRPPASNEPTIKRITILDEKDENAFEVLPGDWIKVRHSSGLPLYLHRPTRVCTLAKPYYLGPASVRRHSVPLSAIPCLAYRRGIEKEQRDKELLEKAKELEKEKPVEEEDSTPAPDESCVENSGGSKESGEDTENKKVSSLAAELGEEKVNLLKRKIMEKDLNGKAKRGKQDSAAANESQGDSQKNVGNKSASSTDPGKGSQNTDAPQTSYHNQPEKRKNLKKTEIPAINKHMQALNNKRDNENIPGLKTLLPLAKVETAKENASLYSVPPLELRDYCKQLFRFSVVECKRFKTWSARRMHSKEQKRRQLERPTLPDNAQVIKFFDISEGGDEQMTKKFNDYIFNPNGKSSVCILHEFVQHALRKQPTYTFQELENAATPYAATVMISNTPYGKGLGSSKRTAKAAAAKATLEILIPKMKDLLNGNKQEPGSDFDITEYFQQVGMNDARIAKLCASISEPSPYTLLLTCLQRSFGQVGSTGVKFDMIPPDPSKGNPPNQFRMSAGKDEVVVTASNKREGKQLASQLLLAKIHPHIKNFGAFIKMYGNGSIKSVKEKKQEEQQITTLQSKASANSPNWAILEKLRQEMLKLAKQEATEKNNELGMDTSSSSDMVQPSPATSAIKGEAGQENEDELTCIPITFGTYEPT